LGRFSGVPVLSQEERARRVSLRAHAQERKEREEARLGYEDSRTLRVASWATQPMTVREFCRIGDYDLSPAMKIRLGVRAGQIFRELMKGRRAPTRAVYLTTERPDQRRPWKSPTAKFHRSHVRVYTFGILRRALNDIMFKSLEDAERTDPEQPKRRRGRPRKNRVFDK
jgi:hypothetical protein